MPGMVPAYTQFAHAHRKTKSAAIAPYDSYFPVTADCDGRPPGSIKNAVDYLYNEWITKPMMIIDYGITVPK